MPMIAEEEIERVKRGIDLAAVIRSRGVELKAQGGDLVGRCPFHDDQNPSLRVTAAKGLWRCMSSACGATGNVIQFVQRFDGVSFRHAYELLKNGAAFTGAPACAPVRKATVPRLPAPVASDADDQAALRQVVDYYHERLMENPAAVAYLKKRGLYNEEMVKVFKLGFVDRTLGLRLPNNQRKEGAVIRERLTRLGVLRETGHEHLRGRVVFPVVNDDGEIATLYGRAIDDGGKHDRHLFLPGPQRGIWNPAALRSPEVIITEGIIDALTFWCAGFKDVTTGYSAKALPEEMLAELVAAKVQRVFIAFDRDEAGDKGAAEVASQLAERGIGALRVLFPHGQDANSYALSVTPPEKSLAVLLHAALPIGGKVSSRITSAPSSLAAKAALEAASAFAKATADGPVVQTINEKPTLQDEARKAAREENFGALIVAKNEGDEIILGLGERQWTVRGLAKNAGLESIKVTLRLECAERWHLDQIDLCVARQRAAFAEMAAGETALRPELVKRDLGQVLLKLEELQAGKIKTPALPKKDEVLMSGAEREAALALLRAPDLLGQILADFAACGVVGEETNKLVGYLAAVSRKLDNPLAVIVQSTSAAGKSALMEAVLAFVPPEERVKYSALTGQALYYLGGEANLKHKILAIVEEEGAEKASYALKLLQSEGELSIASTGKDPHTGRMVTQEYRVEGPVMIFLTTTAVDIDEELLNRCLVLTVDEGREQTAAIHRLQRERETLAGLLRKEDRNRILNTHRAAQRLLRPLHVVNPFAEKLTFLDDRTRTRRDHGKYLGLIRAVALLHQHQREVKEVEHAGKTLEYIEVTLADIAAANRLAHQVLGRCLDEMPPQTRRLLSLVERMVTQCSSERKVARADVLFRARELREFTGWGNSQLHLHLGRLAELEYVLTHRADHGQGFVYELVYDGGGKDGRRFLPGLIDVEKLRGECGYDEKRPGQNEDHPGLIRAISGPLPGVVRPHETAAFSSGASVVETALRENTHQGEAVLAAS